MYKYLICWRYLQTRYIALASVVSVMLGVATMIVVNAVMAGFSEKLRDRLHGVLADVVVESYDLDGVRDYDAILARIRETAGDQISAMAVTLETVGLMKLDFGGMQISKQVQIIGVVPTERARTGDFAEYLVDGRGEPIPPSFEVPEALRQAMSPAAEALASGPTDPALAEIYRQEALEQVPDRGALVGWALATTHRPGAKHDDVILPPGSKIGLVFPRGGRKPDAGYDSYTVVGYFKSGMSEYDANFVYVPLERLQQMRLLGDGEGNGAINQIQIQAKPGVDLDRLAASIHLALDRMRPMAFRVRTWEQMQGPLLAAVAIEQSILNILLFFIIAVAGFGILAIFSMIVVEKTRDIGILKALGAPSSGVRGIFLGYGLLLGMVGSGVGMAGGLLFVRYINEIEAALSKLTGQKVFDDTIYYFDKIPTMVDPWTVGWVVVGALGIAVAASVWPAYRAARLHPVRALRFD